MSTNKPRLPFPENLPESEMGKALWFGYEASRWFPFDPLLYLERALRAGSVVQLCGDGIAYSEPFPANPEHEFLRGWHNGTPDAQKQVAQALRDNPEIHEAHLSVFRNWGKEA